MSPAALKEHFERVAGTKPFQSAHNIPKYSIFAGP